MTKAELINEIHARTGGEHTKKLVGELVDATFDVLADAVREGRFSYPGFGTFKIKHRKARVGRNPRTNEKIQIPASKTVGFKPAPKLKDSL